MESYLEVSLTLCAVSAGTVASGTECQNNPPPLSLLYGEKKTYPERSYLTADFLVLNNDYYHGTSIVWPF